MLNVVYFYRKINPVLSLCVPCPPSIGASGGLCFVIAHFLGIFTYFDILCESSAKHMACQDLVSMKKNKNKLSNVSSTVEIGSLRVHMGFIPDPHIVIPFANDFFLSKYCRTDILNGTYISAKPTPEKDNGIIGAATRFKCVERPNNHVCD